jgi:hypothetical protein
MANCHIARRQLELVDFDESVFLGADVERHLDDCSDCRAYATDMRALREMLADQPRVVTPPNFETVLKARIRRESPLYREPRLAWIPTPALAAIALVTVVSVSFAVRSNFAPVEPVNVASVSTTLSAPVSERTPITPTAMPVAIAARPVSVRASRPVRPGFSRFGTQNTSAKTTNNPMPNANPGMQVALSSNGQTNRVKEVPGDIFGFRGAVSEKPVISEPVGTF